MISFSSSAETA